MTARQKALIIDDEPDIRELLEITLGRMKLDTRSARNLKEARELLAREHYDLCLTDMRLPDGSGLELVQHIQQQYPQLPVAMITAYGSLDTAIGALKAGAFDFLTKPVDLNRLRELVSTALRLRAPAAEAPVDSRLLGSSPPMKTLRKQIGKLARSRAPVYISGESGSGKELVARLIHEQARAAKAIRAGQLRCHSVGADGKRVLRPQEGQLQRRHRGQARPVRAANGGTLFLDEVADLPLPMQVNCCAPSRKGRACRWRCAGSDGRCTHPLCHPQGSRQRGRRRPFSPGSLLPPECHRTACTATTRTPGRHRPARRCHAAPSGAGMRRATARLHPDALAKLENYRFPGNVRELENMLERAYTLCEGDEIKAGDLRLADSPGLLENGEASRRRSTTRRTTEEIERKLIMQALEETRWNRTAAAQRLGLTFRSMRYRLKKLGTD